DAKGKELRTMNIQVKIANGIGGVEFLRNGGLLAVQGDRLAEYDPTGKITWSVAVKGPYPVTRLPNGHTLIASTAERRFLPFDPRGREVWEHKVEGTSWLARRR